MLTLHHLETSRSQRVLWLLEELNLPYALQTYPRDAKTRLAPPALKRIHPLGLSPILCDRGLVIAESGAIIEYLAERYGAWAPPTWPTWIRRAAAPSICSAATGCILPRAR